MRIKISRVVLATLWTAVLSACGGGGGNDGGGNPPPPPVPTAAFGAATAQVAENGNTTLTVSLSAAASAAVSIPFTLSGTATSGTDYTATASPLTIAVGSTSATITITSVDDATDEPDETVIVTLGSLTNATPGATSVSTVTIADNDPTVVTGNLSGRVTDASTGSGVAGVTVTARGQIATTAADGSYTLNAVPVASSVMITFARTGYVPQSRTTESLASENAQAVVNVPV